MNDHLDATDSAILAEATARWEARRGPRVGDFVRLPDGTTRRFTYDHGDRLQTTTDDEKRFGSSFYFDRAGCMDFSGGLDPGVDLSALVETTETKPGRCWFFHHGQARAHNGVTVEVPCRIYELHA
jgi:hypothetical protein